MEKNINNIVYGESKKMLEKYNLNLKAFDISINDSPTIMTLEQLSTALEVPAEELLSLATLGELPSYDINGATVFALEDLKEYSGNLNESIYFDMLDMSPEPTSKALEQSKQLFTDQYWAMIAKYKRGQEND